ncbi:MAG TPA: metal-dependent hydrolase, partial [Candidatus Dormibacteraeota bacterium]|nr:metal-dependent hydrolase [Candidatus Dormibacteraeota bacterium]
MALGRDTTFTWYGHACVEVRTPGGKTVLIDPWFGNPRSPKRADQVDRCDVMLVTHGHGDHFGDALPIASRTRPDWPTIHEMSLWLQHNFAHKDKVVGMNKGGTVSVSGLKVTMTAADHSAGDWDDRNETTKYLGEPVGFIVEVENGFRFYHAGDTEVFGDMRLIGELWRPELAILPIGGHFTMDPRAAALAVEMLGVKHVIPIHYGTFPLLAGTPDQLRDELSTRGLGDVEVHAPEPGG